MKPSPPARPPAGSVPTDEAPAKAAPPPIPGAVDISDVDRFVVTETIPERQLRDAYLEWCMKRHGSRQVVSAMTGVSTKSIYNRARKRAIEDLGNTG